MNNYRASIRQNDTYAFKAYPDLTNYQRAVQDLVPHFSGKDRSGVHRCNECGEIISKWEISPAGIVVNNHAYDLSVTYDGLIVASEKFMLAYKENNLTGLEFRQLPDDPLFYAIHAIKKVEFDSEKRKTRFVNPCQKCGQYQSVVGATPIYLKGSAIIQEREFVTTDLEFGSGDEKGPLLICGQKAAEIMIAANLKGVDFILIEAK